MFGELAFYKDLRAMATANDKLPGDAKSVAISWLAAQGVPTVLLFTIIGLVWWGVPVHLEQIKEGYQKIADQNSKDLQRIVESHEKDRELFLQMMKEQRP